MYAIVASPISSWISSNGFTCSFFGPEMKDSLLWCGKHSGRDGTRLQQQVEPVYISAPDGPDRVTFKQATWFSPVRKLLSMHIEKNQFRFTWN